MRGSHKNKKLKLSKGTLCVSLDTELVWGRHDLAYFRSFLTRAQQERPIINKLVAYFEKNKIPVTWAVIGHLFLNECKKRKNIKHPEVTHPVYPWVTGDWFQNDPCSNRAKNSEWYGDDIVELLKKTRYQEIASHSFSHLIFDEQFCSKEAAESDIKACIEIAKKEGVTLSSFVFPRNKVGHLPILEIYGFNAFRGSNTNSQFPLSKLKDIYALLLSVPPQVFTPTRQNNMINIPESMYFPSARGKRKYIPKGMRYLRAKRGIDRAIQEKKVFHLWTHPTDFADQTEKLIEEFLDIFEYALMKRREGKLDIMTMRQISRLL